MSDRLCPRALIGTRYRVVRFIAEGSSSDVYEARDVQSGAPVAVKLLRPAGSDGDDDPRARCDLEARICTRFDHPNLVRLLDTGTTEDRQPFLVMELLSGVTLKDRLLKVGRLPVQFALEIGEQLFNALSAAHGVGVVHCDVKPRNIVLNEGPAGYSVKLVDFGISELLGESASDPASEYAMGTPAYMAPEQLSGANVDERVDIYSAGVVLYEMITGRRPFDAPDLDMLTRSILVEPILPPSLLRGSCPLALEELVLRCLERNRKRRPRTARTVVEALESIALCGDRPSSIGTFREMGSTPPPARGSGATAKTRRVLNSSV